MLPPGGLPRKGSVRIADRQQRIGDLSTGIPDTSNFYILFITSAHNTRKYCLDVLVWIIAADNKDYFTPNRNAAASVNVT